MDCKNARLLMTFAQPANELDSAEALELQRHLDECPYCNELVQSDTRFDRTVGKAMLAVEPPEGLRMRLLTKLDQQRDAWYRRFGTRVAAAAAVLLILVGGSWYLVSSWRTPIDSVSLIDHFGARNRATHEQVNEWIAKKFGHGVSAPPDFNYQLLVSYEMVEFHGHLVPELLFVRHDDRGEYARVYILSEDNFQLVGDGQQVNLPGSGIIITVIRGSSGREIYLIVHSSPDLNDFRSPLN